MKQLVMVNKNKKIIVTGASGFIGTHLIHALRKQEGFIVVGIDIERRNEECDEWYSCDFMSVPDLQNVLSGTDCVFHLAAIVGVDRCQEHPELVEEVNYKETLDFFAACQRAHVGKIIFSSSSEIYGNSKEIPFKEDAEVSPISLYAKDKRAVELHLQNFTEISGIPAHIVRFFNVYGPRQRKDFVVAKFIDKAQSGTDIEIYGSGIQKRCFTYVDDAIAGLMALLEYNDSAFEIFNIGSPFEYTVSDVAQLVKEIMPESLSKIIHRQYGIDDVRKEFLEIDRRVPDISKARNILKFEPRVDLPEGIHKIISEYEKK
jgi:UDP-glucose 4-epimerase